MTTDKIDKAAVAVAADYLEGIELTDVLEASRALDLKLTDKEASEVHDRVHLIAAEVVR